MALGSLGRAAIVLLVGVALLALGLMIVVLTWPDPAAAGALLP